jgi:predicted ATPase/DNA-binding SARP family transcriptional activator
LLRIRLLGEFGVDRDGTTVQPREWRLRKARTLVKLLALAPDQRLHREVLLDLLWPGRKPVSAQNNLHQALHVARRVLAGGGPHTGLLELADDVVVLRARELVEVDVGGFERLAALARAGGDPRPAIAAYSGDLLPEDRFEDWAARRRDELREALGDLLVAVAETSADEAEAVAAARRALAADPVQERAVRALMRRLATAGRQSEALAQYGRLRDELRSRLGTDPDPRTRRLYRELLTGGPAGRDPVVGGRHNLASALTTFVGREREIADIHRLLAPGGLLTLTGVGGAGKTRLAEESARRLLDSFPDGVWIAELAQVSDPGLVADAVAAALRLDPSAGTDPVRTLAGRLASRTLLLVLDNCEHLLTACAALAGALRRSCPRVTLLTTSREPLHVPGEVTFRVPSLELPDAARTHDPQQLAKLASVRLFLDRARDARPGYALTPANAPAVVEICRRLDGIPLALELAAARLSHLEAAEIADRLSEALTLLGHRGAVTRHATLRAALEWSHDLLGDDERVLLRRLAVFAGSFTLAAAERVCAGERLPRADILDCLGRLADKSLVQIERGGQRSRYRLLETIRQLSRERLGAAGEAAALESAHCAHFLERAWHHDPERASGIVVERPQLLDADHDDLRAALGWAVRHSPARALLLAVSLWRYWLARGHFVEGAGWLDRILAIPAPPTRERARGLFALAVLEARRGISGRLTALGDDGVAVTEQAGDPVEVAYARLQRGTLLLGVGPTAAAEQAAAAALGGGCADAPVDAAACWLTALAALFREDVAAARQRFTACAAQLATVDRAAPPFLPAVTVCLPLMPVAGTTVPVFEESWLLGRRVGAEQGRAYALSALGYAHRLAGDLDAALGTVRQAAGEFARLGDDAGLAHALNHLGCCERDAGSYDAAGDHLGEARRLRERLGDRRGENLTLANLGLLAAARGDTDQARGLAGAALDRGETVDDGPATAGALLNLAVTELLAGRRQAARLLVDQAVEAFEPQGYPRLEAWTRLLAAELARDDGDRDTLARHGGAAAALFDRLDCRIGQARAAALSRAKPVRRRRP